MKNMTIYISTVNFPPTKMLKRLTFFWTLGSISVKIINYKLTIWPYSHLFRIVYTQSVIIASCKNIFASRRKESTCQTLRMSQSIYRSWRFLVNISTIPHFHFTETNNYKILNRKFHYRNQFVTQQITYLNIWGELLKTLSSLSTHA